MQKQTRANKICGYHGTYRMKSLRLYNISGGTARWIGGTLNPNRIDKIFVAGFSQADCVRRINSTLKRNMTVSHLRAYGSNVWGNAMKDIVPEPGVWITRDYNGIPEKVA